MARGEDSRLLDLAGVRQPTTLDVVFPVLHGPYGEDGSVQGLCKMLRPYFRRHAELCSPKSAA